VLFVSDPSRTTDAKNAFTGRLRGDFVENGKGAWNEDFYMYLLWTDTVPWKLRNLDLLVPPDLRSCSLNEMYEHLPISSRYLRIMRKRAKAAGSDLGKDYVAGMKVGPAHASSNSDTVHNVVCPPRPHAVWEMVCF
jgi:hypothetical protein